MTNEKESVMIAIELKFKTKKQGAEDWGRIDSYQDISHLETLKNKGYHSGFFFMITDDHLYLKQSKRGTGVMFPMHEKAITPCNIELIPTSKGRQNRKIIVKKPYKFDWQTAINYNNESWYFLKIDV